MAIKTIKKTTITVSEELKEALRKMGNKGETYEDIIWRMIKNER